MAWKIKHKRPEDEEKAEDYYAKDAERYSKSNAMKRIQRKITMRALELALIPLQARVLDVGCGTGYSMEVLKEVGYKRVQGVDVSAEMLAAAKKKKLEVKLGSATDLPFPANSFDAIASISTLQWLSVEDAARAAREFGRVLAKGGRAVIQFYPKSEAEMLEFGDAFRKAGFAGRIVVDNPDNARKRKVFLLLARN